MTLFLIDVSSFQAGIPIEDLPHQGFSAIFIKATQGIGYTNPYFADHLRRARATGMLTAAYHFMSHGVSPSAQAAHIASVVPRDVPIWLDQEAGATLAESLACGSVLASQGFTVAGNYGNRPPAGWGWWRAAYLTDPRGYASSAYAALGGDNSSAWVGQDIWQYCQHGNVSNYSGEVDFSAYRGTIDELASSGWFWVPDSMRVKTPQVSPITEDDDMFVQATSASTDGSVGRGAFYQTGPGTRHWITDTDVRNAIVSSGVKVVQLSGDQILAQWPVVAPANAQPATVDVNALAAQLVPALANAIPQATEAQVETALRAVLPNVRLGAA